MDATVVVVGAGFAGLGTAIKLKQAGIEDFVVLEKADEVGGTWRDNTYPGCACDVQSHLYSFSYAPKSDWSRMFARQPEILDYLREVVDRFDLRRHLRFGHELTGAEYAEDGTWTVRTSKGDLTCRALVLGLGPLHKPRVPDLPGLADFAGTVFHSAQWDHSYDFAGKRVAVIGTGASAVQFVPQLAPLVESLTLVQRTPPWVMPKPDRPIGSRERRLYGRLPALQKLYRDSIYWRLEGRVLGMTLHPKVMVAAQAVAKWNLNRAVEDPALRAKLTPDYVMGCKRILISNDYYPAVARDNVHVETSGVREVRTGSVVLNDGREVGADAIVFGTGFHVTDAYDDLPITGAGGRKLNDAWAKGMEAYLGMSVAGFPNLFFLVGPNTGLGHNSIVFMVEAEATYIVQAVRLLLDGAKTMDVRPRVQQEYNAELQRDLAGTVWNTGGCTSWYLDEHGNNRTLWPGFTWRYWLRTRRLEKSAYELG